MRVLIFDTETTGLPKSKIINPDTLKLWPHIVQFSYVIYDTSLNDIIETSDSIIKLKNGMPIPEDSIKIHGITNTISQKNGIDLELVLNEFFHHLKNVDLLVGHNVSFDINMVKIELLRLIYDPIPSIMKNEYKLDLHFITNYTNIYCTLQKSIHFCNIRAIDKFGIEYAKFPKLVELHQKLFESVPNNLHNSLNDILVTLRCFIKLKCGIDLNKKCSSFMKMVKERNLL